MTDQVRVLEPPAGLESPRHRSPTPSPVTRASPSLPNFGALAGALFLLVGIGVVLWLAPPPGTDFGIAPSEVRPDFVATADVEAGLSAIDQSLAIATVRELGRAINLGDSASVVELLVDRPPRRTEFRRAEWPLLPTDAGWWSGGVVDRDAVEGSVRYIFTVPGSVFLSTCEAERGPVDMGGVTVTCNYTASGGPLKALGQLPGTGHVHVMLVDGLVAGVERHGSTDRALWSDFARWAVDNDALAFYATLGNTNGSIFLDPVYSGDSALVHVGLAELMAMETTTGGGRSASTLR